MATSVFDDKAKKPKAAAVTEALGRTGKLWDELRKHLSAQFKPFTEEWIFGGKSWGWALRLKHKKRAIVYLTPCQKHFMAGFALGEKAVKAAHAAGLPAEILEVIDTAQKYAEGRAVRLEVRNKKNLAAVQQIAAIKMAN